MSKYIPFEKMSKRSKRVANARRRCGWGPLNPVTRRAANPRAYNRNKEKKDMQTFISDKNQKNR